MDINALQAFTAVAEKGSFSRAAESLFVTQPAVSKRIALLEQALGTRLFDRIGHGVSLTQAGERLLPRARDLLSKLDDMAREIGNLSGEVSGSLSMGTSHHIGLHRLPPVLRHYSAAFPEVDLDIRFMDSEQACNEVARGTLELGIVTLPRTPADELEILPLWKDRLHVVAGRDHPLAAIAHPKLSRLVKYGAVLPSASTFTRGRLQEALGDYADKLHVTMSTNYMETLKMLAVIGLGWTVLPATMLDEKLARVDVSGLHISRDLGIVTHRQRTLSNAARAMIEACRAEAGADRPAA
ncbi:MAG: LysR family transcriptional regulator [Pseudomonadota bacterium]